MTHTEDAQIVTTAEEQAAKELQQQTAELNAFVAALDMENMPACVRGMALLKRFADASPSGFQMAMRGNFVDPLDLKHPLFAQSAKWQAFIQHRSDCPDCNEAF